MLRNYLVLLFSLVWSLSDSTNVISVDSSLSKEPARNLSLKDILSAQDSLDSEDLFEVQLYESKILLAESIIADLTGDTIEAKFQFDLLFESLSNLDAFTTKDEFQELEMNRLLTA